MNALLMTVSLIAVPVPDEWLPGPGVRIIDELWSGVDLLPSVLINKFDNLENCP